jgi:uncharacterized membrane protein
MEEGSEKQPPDAGPRGPEPMAALTARVSELERQVARLNAWVGQETTGVEPPRRPVTESVKPLAEEVPKARVPVPPIVAPAKARGGQSLENRLGSQVFSRVGIFALLIGATWFLKLAIDNQWIGPVGRVLAGLIAGAGLVVWSERFRSKGFPAFSYTLKAVGSGILYLSLWAAFQLYHLLPGSAALVAMLLVTAWNAYMAWAQNAEMLAAYALVGGFATPLLLSTGGNHEIFLFTYLLAIDVAMVVLVRVRPWPRLLLGAFPVTVAYFIGWFVEHYSAEQFGITAVFIALFFLVFASVPLRDGRKEPRGGASVITEILLPLGNAAFGALAMYSVLQDSGQHDVLPWMVLLFAAFYLGVMRLPQSAVASAVHLSLAIVFLTIAIPLKASGRWITVSWLVEGTALMWVAARLFAAGEVKDESPADAYRVLHVLAIGALLLGFGGLMLRMYEYDSNAQTAFLNHRFATALVGIAAFAATAWIAWHAQQKARDAGEDESKLEQARHFWVEIAGGAVVAVNLIAVLATVREISAMWSHPAASPEADLQQALAISAFLMLYGGALLAVGFWKRSAFVRWQALVVIVFTIGKTFVYDMRNLSQGYRVASFMGLGALLLAVSFAYQRDWLALKSKHADEDAQQRESV